MNKKLIEKVPGKKKIPINKLKKINLKDQGFLSIHTG